MRRTRRSEFSFAMSIRRDAFAGSSSATPAASRPSEPEIEVSGVRSSWLTVDTKPDLRRSTSSRAEMSRTTPMNMRRVPTRISLMPRSTGTR